MGAIVKREERAKGRRNDIGGLSQSESSQVLGRKDLPWSGVVDGMVEEQSCQ